MIRTIYLIIVAYFLLGGIAFYFINRKKESAEAKKSRIKFISYLVIIHILFFSIVINPFVFRILSIMIIIMGVFELLKLFRNADYKNKRFFAISLILYILLSTGFYFFSGMEKEMILFSFLALSIFDSFSQITGQLFGKKKILPEISPAKTLEGLTGGALIAVFSSLLFKELIEEAPINPLLLSAVIVAFAFIGDLLASCYKRKYKVKDFSNLIPGHGGFLDRFDSLIAGGAVVAFIEIFVNL